jgi:hypothetical protein
MTIKVRDQVGMQISLSIIYLDYETPQEGYYSISCFSKKNQFETSPFILTQNRKTMILQIFHFSFNFTQLSGKSFISKKLKLKLTRNGKTTKQQIGFWKFDLNLLQFQNYLSLNLLLQSNSNDLGKISFSLMIAENTNLPSVALSINHPEQKNIQNQLDQSRKLFIHSLKKECVKSVHYQNSFSQTFENELSSFLDYQQKLEQDSFQGYYPGKNCIQKIKHFGCNLYPYFNQLTGKIINHCDELINEDLEQIASFPLISKKILGEVFSMKPSFGLIALASQWSETLLCLEQQDNRRKIYALVATIHIISVLDKKQILSKDDLKIIICSFITLYSQVFNSILENSKEHFRSEDQMKIFCQNLLEEFNQIGSGEYCNLIYSSLLMNFLHLLPDEFSDNLCQYFCIIKNTKNEMKKVNIHEFHIYLLKSTFDWLAKTGLFNSR